MELLQDRLWSVAEVTARTGLSERTIRAMIADGRLPVIRLVGLRAVRVPEAAVFRLMQGRDARAEDRP